ncbi:MAG: hypothetical protein AAGD14_17770 [Planctomycetota bacterium]
MPTALFAFAIGGLLWGVAIHVVRFVVDRDIAHSFATSVYLGLGIKIAALLVVLLLGGLFGPFILAPVFFVAWAILARYGRLSEFQAAAAVALLIALDFAWALTGLA